MNKLLLMAMAGVFAAIAYGNTTINNPGKGINVPYMLYNQGKGSVTDDINSSKLDLSKQFLIRVDGKVASSAARINVKSLVLKDHVLYLTYKLEPAGKAISPASPRQFFFALIVDKKYQAEVKLVDF
jgi:hypothetical protein